MTLEFDASDFFRKTRAKEVTTTKAMVESMHDTTDDLARIAQNIAPIESGVLRASAKATVKPYPKSVVGEVTMSAVNKEGNGRFNYAYWTHEMDYNLGPISAGAPGKDGYNVGNKYLERPLKGESQKYVNMWAEDMRKELEE
jgi:hypothetical protein